MSECKTLVTSDGVYVKVSDLKKLVHDRALGISDGVKSPEIKATYILAHIHMLDVLDSLDGVRVLDQTKDLKEAMNEQMS